MKKRGWGAPKLFIEKVKHKRFLYFQVFIFSWLTRQYTTPPWGGLLSLYVYTNKNTLTQLVSYGSYVLMLASQAAISSSTSAAVRGVGGGGGGWGAVMEDGHHVCACVATVMSGLVQRLSETGQTLLIQVLNNKKKWKMKFINKNIINDKASS